MLRVSAPLRAVVEPVVAAAPPADPMLLWLIIGFGVVLLAGGAFAFLAAWHRRV